jgi:sortase (surface protein transpeptidase)
VTSSNKRRPSLLWWTAACLVLIGAGVAGIIFVPRSAPVGPTILKPIGEITLPKSGVVIPSPTTTAPSTTTTGKSTTVGSSMGALTSASESHPTLDALQIGSTVSHSRDSAPGEFAATRQSNLRSQSTSPVLVAEPIGRSVPVHLAIPKIGVSVRLSILGLNRKGTVNIPTNFAVPGWYKGDRSPGQKGSAVILGHVDSTNGPAIFYKLDKLRLGNRIDVTLRNGKKLVFAVIGIRMFQKTNFPDRLVYGARTYPALQLVTCGGIFDPSTNHYLSNIVVFTALIKS